MVDSRRMTDWRLHGKVTGAEAHPSVVLPEGDHSGKYLAVGPFDYSGPLA